MSSFDKGQARKTKRKTKATAKKMTTKTTATQSEPALIYFSGWRMKREHFVKVVEDALDSLPQEFRSRIRNVAVLVEDMPPNQPSSQSGQQGRLLLGLFHGVPTTKKSIFDLTTGPDYIVLYQEEYWSGLLQRGPSPRTNPPDGHPWTGPLFRDGWDPTEGCLAKKAGLG